MTPYVENGDPAPLWRVAQVSSGLLCLLCAWDFDQKTAAWNGRAGHFFNFFIAFTWDLKKKKHDKSPSPSIFVAVQNWAHGVPLLMLIYDGTQMVDIRGRDVFLSVDPDGF